MSLAYKLRLLPHKVYEMTHPREPWLARGAIRYLDKHLDRQGLGIEWGSGRSTQWFGPRLGRLVSVEDNQAWYMKVKRQTAHMANVDLRLLNASGGAASPYVQVIEDFDNASLAFALVDGSERHACVTAVLSKMAAGGLLVVDNSNWPEFAQHLAATIPPEWPKVAEDENARSRTTVWQRPG